MTENYDFATLHVCIHMHALPEPSSVMGFLHIASFVQLRTRQHVAGQRRLQNENCEHAVEASSKRGGQLNDGNLNTPVLHLLSFGAGCLKKCQGGKQSL